MSADQMIASLELERHPEGGWFRETYRAPSTTDVRGGRSLATVIYFVLRAGELSQWHKVASDELWLYQGGDALTLRLMSDGDVQERQLGLDVATGAQPQILVPADVWQSAVAPTDGAHGWTLVACVVTPGFDFADFVIASEHEDPPRLPQREERMQFEPMPLAPPVAGGGGGS